MHSHDISLFFIKKKQNKVMPALLFGLVLPLNATWADQQSSTNPQNSNIVIERNPNQAPEVDAGDDQTVLERDSKNSSVTVKLKGKASDIDAPLTYAWTQIDTTGIKVKLSNSKILAPTFKTVEVTQDTVLTFRLSVKDRLGAVATDDVNITVKQVNRAPKANAGTDQTVTSNSTATLSGSGTDPDGDALSYAWTQTDTTGVKATLSDATVAAPTFTAPSVTQNTTLTFQLVVTDTGKLSATDTVNVTVSPPPPPAPTNVKATAGDGKVTVSWDAVQGASSYSICHAPETITDPDNCISASQNAVSLPNQTSPADIPNLLNGTQYHFIVSVEDTNGHTAHSNEVTATPTKPVAATNKLNDTGITKCGNAAQNNRPCPQAGFEGQDAETGRDANQATNNDADGYRGFSFTKISSTGAELPASATAWSCVKDNVTGLMWEVKTDDSRLHDKDWAYSWYEPDSTKNGGDAGSQNHVGSCGSTSQCDTYAYVQTVNAAGWCGAKDWRLPTVDELSSITVLNGTQPAIDSAYFPNTRSANYWSASPVAGNGGYAWGIHFNYGYGSQSHYKYNAFQVRLVRSGQ